MGDFTDGSVTLEHDAERDAWIITIHDGLRHHSAVLPPAIVDALAQRIVAPQPVLQAQVQWGIRWAEDPGTVQGPLDEDYAKRKASPSYGDVVVRRTRTDYRPTFTAWEPISPSEPWQGLET